MALCAPTGESQGHILFLFLPKSRGISIFIPHADQHGHEDPLKILSQKGVLRLLLLARGYIGPSRRFSLRRSLSLKVIGNLMLPIVRILNGVQIVRVIMSGAFKMNADVAQGVR